MRLFSHDSKHAHFSGTVTPNHTPFIHNLLLERSRGLTLVVLIPLVLSFLLLLGCAPTASTSASPPDEPQQVANLIKLSDNSLTITVDRTAATPTLIITGLTNVATGTLPAIPIDQTTGITTTPPSIDFTSLTPSVVPISPADRTLTLEVTFGTAEAVSYTLNIVITGAPIDDWFNGQTLATYFSGATFAGQAATLTLGADKVITIAAASEQLTNVPNGALALTANANNPIPAGFTLTSALTDPDGSALAAIVNGDAGTLILIETSDKDNNSQTNTVQISLAAYTSPVVAADVVATFDGTTASASDIEIVGNVITISGFTNIEGEVGSGLVVITDTDSTAAYTLAPNGFTIMNPAGTAATNVELMGSPATLTLTSGGFVLPHKVEIKFRPSFTSLALNVTGADVTDKENILKTGTEAERTITVTALACEIAALSVDVIIGTDTTPSALYSVANPPVYYDRSVLADTMDSRGNIIRTQTPMPIPTNLRIVDAAGELVTDPFPLIVNFTPCDTSGVMGRGDELSPYQISKPEHLEFMAHLVNNSNATRGASYFKLTANIDLEVAKAPWTKAAGGLGFTPIGVPTTATFKGTFDCDNKTIANLYINNLVETGFNSGSITGLFGAIGGGTIMNCQLINPNVTGLGQVGALVGQFKGIITNSSVVGGTVTGTREYTGGLVGYTYAGAMITNSYATATVSGDDRVGGLVGYNGFSSSIRHSYATGNVTGTGSQIGGLAGANDFGSSIQYSYAAGDVMGNNIVGGLLGINGPGSASENDMVMYSYATGKVTGNIYVGGLVGRNNPSAGLGVIINSYAIGSVTGTTAVGRLLGGNGTVSSSSSKTTGITSSYYLLDDDGTGEGVGVPIGVSGVTGRTMAQLQVIQGSADGETYFGWDAMEWNFTAGNYPRLINVVCASRQYNTDQGTCIATLP